MEDLFPHPRDLPLHSATIDRGNLLETIAFGGVPPFLIPRNIVEHDN